MNYIIVIALIGIAFVGGLVVGIAYGQEKRR